MLESFSILEFPTLKTATCFLRKVRETQSSVMTRPVRSRVPRGLRGTEVNLLGEVGKMAYLRNLSGLMRC
jgi:hypothetical protein